MGLFSSLRAARKLMKISRILGDQAPIFVEHVLSFSKISVKIERAEEELFDLVQSLPKLQVVLNQHGAGREKLSEIYHDLNALGCGQWIRGYYVATAALVYRETLETCLQHFDNKTMNIRFWDNCVIILNVGRWICSTKPKVPFNVRHHGAAHPYGRCGVY